MNSDLTPLLWPASRLGEALLAFAQTKTKSCTRHNGIPTGWKPPHVRSVWKPSPSKFPTPISNVSLPKIGPAILHVPAKDGDAFLVILPGLTVLTSNRRKGPHCTKRRPLSLVRRDGGAGRSKRFRRRSIVPAFPAPSKLAPAPRFFENDSALDASAASGFCVFPPSANFWQQLRAGSSAAASRVL